jgi:hypothetical protein
MSLRWIAGLLNAAASKRLGLRVVRTSALYPWQLDPPTHGMAGSAELPARASDYLRPDHPRLLELVERYAAVDPRVTIPASWVPGKLSARDLLLYRRDNAFVWQVRGSNANPLSYALTYYYLRSRPERDLLERFDEDGAFGAVTFAVDGREISRDLLDSAGEIEFLRQHAGLGQDARTILDIGAGYGRLAHRIAETCGSDVRVFATDAVAASSFVCEHYLNFRGHRHATAVALDELDSLLATVRVDLAVNVHSFSECTAAAVEWWTERLADHDVPRLMVVPNGAGEAGTRCRLNDGSDMEAIFARFGYRAVVRKERYSDPLLARYGIEPAWLHLFERQRSRPRVRAADAGPADAGKSNE